MTEILHHVPGRLRVRVGALKGDRPGLDALAAAMRARHGVTGAEPNPVTGSLLLIYDPASSSAVLLLLALAEMGYDGARSPAPAGLDRLGTAAVEFAIDRLVERSALALVAVLV